MTDKPIPFTAPMVRALLDGRKTQTRPIFTPPPPFDPDDDISTELAAGSIKPRYAPGDRLWVREAFAISGIGWGKKPSDAKGGKVHYRADPKHGWHDYWGSWGRSIYMPRWASRLTLIVTDVRVQRLHDISEADAVAEGIEPHDGIDPECSGFRDYYKHAAPGFWRSAKGSFGSLWNSVYGLDAWDENPWVCALTFTVHACNIDDLPALLERITNDTRRFESDARCRNGGAR